MVTGNVISMKAVVRQLQEQVLALKQTGWRMRQSQAAEEEGEGDQGD